MIRDRFVSISDLLQNGLVTLPVQSLQLSQKLYWGAAAAIVVVVIAGLAWRAWSRRPSATGQARPAWLVALGYLALAGALGIASAAIALGFFLRKGIGAERLVVLQAMAARPHDPWPRGTGHVPLGTLGAQAHDKAYVEPGGSGSPWVGSFGLSLWVVDAQGKIIATSDSINEADTQQSYLRQPGKALGLAVSTRLYEASWQIESDQVRTLKVTSKLPAGQQLLLAIRAPGPAGGPLQRIQVDGRTIELNGRWRLAAEQAFDLAYIGTEGPAGWTSPGQGPGQLRTASDEPGWAHARVRLPQGGSFVLTITDPARPASTGLQLAAQALVLHGVDERFARSLTAQIDTLKQGVVGQEIRPGDPINYPLPWLRDNAFQIVALARAGEVDLARHLSRLLAEKDFFGGFGAEGDNPGLALWSLKEVAQLANDPAFKQQLWQHVQRKVALIHEELQAKTDIHHDYYGPIVPFHTARTDLTLAAGPAVDGMINGRMDLHHPLFFVSAANYAGLVAAADLARELGHAQEAGQWAADAQALRTAWQKAFLAKRPGYDNERTSIFSLWPAEIAPQPAFEALLQKQWDQERTPDGGFKKIPLWSYFTVADAHQWLRVGRPDRTWQTLEWLWSRDTTPGLFTLWEGDGEENTFRLWRDVRGWVNPPYVTPHHWSASELLLLQLGMLAETQGSGSDRRLVIGAGVQAAWLAKPIDIQGVGTDVGFVNWRWDGQAVTVSLPKASADLPIRLGAAFPAGTVVHTVLH